MRMDVSMTGDKELIAKLQQLPAAMSRSVQLAALKAGAEPIREMASTLAPRDERAGAPHLADNIIIGVASKRALDAEGLFDVTAVEIGPSQPFFYGFFQEVGTAFAPAQPFLRPAFDSQVRRSLRIVASEAWIAIRKRLNLGRGLSTSGGNL